MTKVPKIDRETYRTKKKKTKKKQQTCLILYADSLREDAPTLDLRELEKDIKGVKGIGEKRAEEIMQIIERHLDILGEEGK